MVFLQIDLLLDDDAMTEEIFGRNSYFGKKFCFVIFLLPLSTFVAMFTRYRMFLFLEEKLPVLILYYLQYVPYFMQRVIAPI